MTHVICQPCIGVKNTACVDVCPVDCIHDGGDMYYIDPDECVDCGACIEACPVQAIFPLESVPEQWKNFIQMNADLKAKHQG